MAEPIVGIVLAAGTSSRLGRPKQLELVVGQPLVTHSVDRMLAAHVDQVLVVTGAYREQVQASLADLAVTFVDNPAFGSGQASSLVAGVRQAVGMGADAIVVTLADQPGIATKAIDALVLARRDGARLGMAHYGDEQGHPVMFGRDLFPELLTLEGDTGGRDIIGRYRQELVLVDGGRTLLPADLDSEHDLAAVLHDLSVS